MQRVIKAERVAELAMKEKKLIEDSLRGELSLRMEAEAEITRTARRAEASAAAASTAMQKIAVMEAKKAEVVHCSVQQVMETQDVQVCDHVEVYDTLLLRCTLPVDASQFFVATGRVLLLRIL